MTTDERKSYIILKDKKIYKGIILLSLPLMFNNILKSLHDIVDMYFVREIGTGAVSSISITWSMIFMFFALGERSKTCYFMCSSYHTTISCGCSEK